jgi:hypothetical protein
VANKSIQTDPPLSHAISKQDKFVQTLSELTLAADNCSNQSAVGSTKANVQAKYVSSDSVSSIQNKSGYKSYYAKMNPQNEFDSNNNPTQVSHFDYKSSLKAKDSFRNSKLLYSNNADQLNDFLNDGIDTSVFSTAGANMAFFITKSVRMPL